jgi:hypothetical protein
MKLDSLTIRKAELVVGVGFVALALLTTNESVKLGPGWGRSGPQPGFFPFSASVLMGLGGLGAVVEALRRKDDNVFFSHPQEFVDFTKVGVPVALAIASVVFLGLYIMSALYVSLFAWWYGRFRWYSAAVAGLVFSTTLYFTLNEGFHIAMPYSIWYGTLLPF